MTAEELAQHAATSQMLEERIAYHEAKAVEVGEISLVEAQRYSSLRAAATAAAKRAGGRITPEEKALRAETKRMVEERVAYHAAKAREEEEAARRQHKST